jgi:hypothetical protein
MGYQDYLLNTMSMDEREREFDKTPHSNVKQHLTYFDLIECCHTKLDEIFQLVRYEEHVLFVSNQIYY